MSSLSIRSFCHFVILSSGHLIRSSVILSSPSLGSPRKSYNLPISLRKLRLGADELLRYNSRTCGVRISARPSAAAPMFLEQGGSLMRAYYRPGLLVLRLALT